jgi:small-conductance mechanosensitive channel
MSNLFKVYFLFTIALFSIVGPALSQEKTSLDTIAPPLRKDAYPILFLSDTIGMIRIPFGVFSASERGNRINNRLDELVDLEEFDTAKIYLQAQEQLVLIFHDDELLGNITAADAAEEGLTQLELANRLVKNLKKSYTENYEKNSLIKNLIRAGFLTAILIVLFLLVKLINTGFNRLINWILRRWEKYFNGLRIKNYEFLTKERQEALLRIIMRIIKVVLIAILLYLSLPLIFSIFPATKGLASSLLGYITDPIFSILNSLIGYIPELFMIMVIMVVTYYVIKLISFISKEIEEEAITIPGFYPDWAKPTFNLLKVIIAAFSFIVIFPYLPGSDSPAFQGVSVFLGLLISLGSSSAISNIIAGLVIIYMRAFKIGDRVTIGDTTGDVVEKTLLVTRIRTTKNEEVTIPNATILAGKTINYSGEREGAGLILHTTVTIGYDVPWRQVHELLISAAKATELIKEDPKPFVLQTSLDDFYVAYQINAYTNSPGKSANIYSALHANIQDKFNEAGVEILSPHYRAERDGNSVTIPPTRIPKES